MADSSRTPNIEIPLEFENYDDDIQISSSQVQPTHHSTTATAEESSSRKTSWVWKYATKSSDKLNVQCKLCTDSFKFQPSHGTGTISRHLLSRHSTQIGRGKG